MSEFRDVSPNVCSYQFSSVSVAEWPPFGKELFIRFTICPLCILTIFILVIFRFVFNCRICVLIATVPDHCLLVAFIILTKMNIRYTIYVLLNVGEQRGWGNFNI